MTVCEKYIGLIPVAQTNADTIVVCIKDMLLRMNHRIQDACVQCYDRCSTMTGTKNGVAAQIKNLNEECLLTHCYCHSLNLAVRDTIKNIPFLKDKLIKKSPKREAELHRKQEEFLGQMERDFLVYDMDSPTLKILCPTLVDSLSCISECYSEELWNFDEAVGMGT